MSVHQGVVDAGRVAGAADRSGGGLDLVFDLDRVLARQRHADFVGGLGAGRNGHSGGDGEGGESGERLHDFKFLGMIGRPGRAEKGRVLKLARLFGDRD
ncbi:hypothetical protein [Caulobacter sp. UC70_42]|uniref:hypothetical protein n=1 Tax=Caulobacter sp. UC70_42 TaxID=3374551 RepID=UPI00375695D3